MIYPENFEHKIDFGKIRELLKEHCLSDLGKSMVDDMRFMHQFETIRLRLTEAHEFLNLLERGDDFPTDHYFWEMLAYCAGTGGSILIIGSAAGVAVMGMEKIDFIWYLKKISLWALIGYIAGALAYIVMDIYIFHTPEVDLEHIQQVGQLLIR